MPDETSRTLPGFALYPATAFLFLTLLYAMHRTKLASGKFLIAVVWLRYVMQAFHEVTHAPILGGASLNALVSMAVCLAGGVVLSSRLREISRFPAVLLLLAAVTLSAVLNSAYVEAIETVSKWGYFFIVALCIFDCIQRTGNANILGTALWAFTPPLLLQALSIALGVSKASEGDGSVSYIGGFDHEAAFSIALLTCFATATLAPRLSPLTRTAILAACIAGILAANYRTSLIALAPLAIGFFAFASARAFIPQQRGLVAAVALTVAMGAVVVAGWLMSDRIADLSMALDPAGPLGKSPSEFTRAEGELLSGRLYLWSLYLEAYGEGNALQLLFGFGPDAWVDAFGLYAHNTLVSYLYEFGAVGAALIIAVWISMLTRAGAIRDPWLRAQVQCAHLGFIVLNLATMPHWMIEGMILYGVLCGYTLALSVPIKYRRPAWAYGSRAAVGAAAGRSLSPPAGGPGARSS